MDVLSELLKAVKLDGAVFFNGEFSAPWCAREPDACTMASYLPSSFKRVIIFQSMPDHWAIDQLFPIVPVHRLDEEPTRRAVLADITCDSDGQVDKFIDKRQACKMVLELHELKHASGVEPADAVPADGKHEPYYLAVALVGAYQEVLGDLHNLYGDTHVVHVSFDDSPGVGDWDLDEVVEGDTVK